MTNSISEGKEKAGMKMTDRIENSLSGLSTLDRKKNQSTAFRFHLWSMKTLWEVIHEAIPSTA